VHSYGGIVFHDVINIRHAKKALGEGVDGLILVCAGAGGHAGMLARSRWCARCAKSSRARSRCRARSPTAAASSAPRRWVPTSPIWAPASSRRRKPTPRKPTSRPWSIRLPTTSSIRPVHRRARQLPAPFDRNAGLDPDNLPVADKTKMDFGSGGNTDKKAWRDIWGSGQGIGQIIDAPPVAELVTRLKAEFNEARNDFVRASA
jgi:nitronate monooxygenase